LFSIHILLLSNGQVFCHIWHLYTLLSYVHFCFIGTHTHTLVLWPFRGTVVMNLSQRLSSGARELTMLSQLGFDPSCV